MKTVGEFGMGWSDLAHWLVRGFPPDQVKQTNNYYTITQFLSLVPLGVSSVTHGLYSGRSSHE